MAHQSMGRTLFALALLSLSSSCGWVDDGGRQGNVPPRAVASDVSTAEQTSGVTLDGSPSSDSDGEIEAYRWQLLQGDASAIIADDASYETATLTFDTQILAAPKSLLFELTVVDNDGSSNSTLVNVDIASVNEPPTAIADNYVAEEGEIRTVVPLIFNDEGTVIGGEQGLLFNDTDDVDVANNGLIVRGIKPGFGPRLGTIVELYEDGGFKYLHNGAEPNGENEFDSFTYLLYDGTFDVESQVTIKIIGNNDPPSGIDDGGESEYAVLEGEVLTVNAGRGVLANDLDPDLREGEVLQATMPGQTTDGVTTLNLDGSFNYIHNGSSLATVDSFTYRPSDDLETAEQDTTVSIVVIQIDDPPVGTGESYTLNENAVMNVAAPEGVLVNDTDDEGQPLTAVSVLDPRYGSLVMNPDGSFDYMHDGSEFSTDSFSYSAVDSANYSVTFTPTVGFTGAASFDYTISDGSGGSDTATVTIDVGSTSSNTTLHTANDSGNTSTIELAASSDDAEQKTGNGKVKLRSDDLDMMNENVVGIRFRNLAIPVGSTIDDAYVQFVAKQSHDGQTSMAIVGQLVGDAQRFTNSNSDITSRDTTSVKVDWDVPAWSIEDAGVAQRTPNLASILREIVAGSGWQNGNSIALIISGSGKRSAHSFDADPARAPRLVISYGNEIPGVATPLIDPAGGTFTSSALVGLTTATAGATVYYTLDGSEPDTTDTACGCPFVLTRDTTVKARAFLEGFTPSDTAVALFEIMPGSAEATAMDDLGKTAKDTPLTFTAAKLLANDSDADGHNLTITSIGNAVNGNVAFNGNRSSPVAVVLNIINVNDVPEIGGIPATSVAEDSNYSFIPTASDPDVGDILTFKISGKPEWAIFNPETGELSGIPDNDDVGIDFSNIIISVSDIDGATVSLPAFSIEVINTNDPPTIAGVPPSSVDEDSIYLFTPTASDPDVGDILMFQITGQPVWAIFDPNTGTLTGTPGNDDVGIVSAIVISVVDFAGAVTSLPAFSIEVINTNDPPTIGGTPPDIANQGSPYSFAPEASDPDVGDTLIFQIIGKPEWATFDIDSGELSGIPGNDDVGNYPGIVISVGDTGGESAVLPEFSIEVTNTNDPPVIEGTPPTSVDEDSAYSFSPTSSDPDVGDTLTFQISGKPDWAIFDAKTGSLAGTPENDHVGIDSGIVISVTDTAGAVGSLPEFSIEVVNTNDPPTISGSPPRIAYVGSTYNFTPTASDPDVGDTLTFQISGKPDWAIFDIDSGGLSGTPGELDIGNHPDIVISVSDNIESISLPRFSIWVLDRGAPITFGLSATAGEDGNSPLADTNCTVFDDLENRLVAQLPNPFSTLAVNYSLLEPADKGGVDIDLQSGLFTYTPRVDERGYRDSFTYVVEDASGRKVENTHTVIPGKLRIMPLGDSITVGATAVPRSGSPLPEPPLQTGYRQELHQAITELGYTVDFVGDYSNGELAGTFDTDHQAHNQYTASSIASDVAAALRDNPAEVVLLHIGTGESPAAAVQIDVTLTAIEYQSILNAVPTRVFVARIIDQHPASPDENLTGSYNAALDEILLGRPEAFVVDMHAALDPLTDLTPPPLDPSGQHPTQSGYARMASAWREKLLLSGVLNKCD